MDAAAISDSVSRNQSKKKKHNVKKKPIPAKGDPDYLTPTQLRNRRKRRAKQQKNNLPTSNSSNAHNDESNSHTKQTGLPNKPESQNLKDPSMKYISNPKNAPIVQTAKSYFKSIANIHVSSQINFQVHLGPLYEWRTVSKLAVRPASNSTNHKPKVAIGLFLPQSHTLLPVPNCRAHHPSINQVVECVTRACHEVGIEPYQECNEVNGETNSGVVDMSEKGRGQLRYIGVNIERKSGAAQLTLVWNGDAAEDNSEGVQFKHQNGAITDTHLAKLVKKILAMATSTNAHDNVGGTFSTTNDKARCAASTEEAQDEPPAKKKRRRGNRDGKSQEGVNRNVSNTSQDATITNATPPPKKQGVNLHSIWINYNLSWKHSNAIFAFDSSCWKHIHGPSSIVEHLEFTNDINLKSDAYAKPSPASYPIPLNFPPNVFRQANLDAFTNIVGRIRERVMKLGQVLKDNDDNDTALPNCIELYGGVGTIGLHLSDIVCSLVSSDENPNNLKCFNESVSTLPAEIQSRLAYKQKNAADMVLTEATLFEKCQLLVVDPPRKGLDAEVVDYLCQTGWRSLKVLVYVSCGFQAFQRDCDALVKSNRWKLEFAEGYLLFPGSDAIETLAFFVPS